VTIKALIIGDSHATPQSPNRRFEWLGNFIVEQQPDLIVSIGDMADMSTLSSYDKGTKAAWGKTYKADVASVRDAQAKLFGPTQKYNNTQGKKKKAGYHPHTIHTLGNHDDGRYNTFLSKNPEFSEHISIKDLHYDEYWTDVVPYLDVATYSGVSFSHFFYNKSQRYPIPSAKAVLSHNHCSSVWGHTHAFDYCMTYSISGRRLIALNPGCFLDTVDRGDTYNYTGGQGDTRWWNGVTVLHDLNPYGEFDVEQISTERLQRDYG